MQKLINYCFKNQIQPYKLRVDGWQSLEYEINYKEPEVEITTFVQKSFNEQEDLTIQKLGA